MQAISRRTLKAFFDWMLNQRRGKDGRRLAGIKSANTLGTYWKVFQLVHERVTGEKIEGKINRKMHQVGSASCLPAESYLNYCRSEANKRLRLFSGLEKAGEKTRPNEGEAREDGDVYRAGVLQTN